MIMWALIMFFAGIALILAEFIMPGMICGVVGGTLVIVSGVLAISKYPDYMLFIIVGEIIGVTISIFFGMFLLARTRAGRMLVLNSSQQADAGWVAAESDTALVGAVGEVFTALRPAGTVIVQNKRIDAVSEGTFIEKGAKVRVTQVHGSRVVVEQVQET